MAVRALVVNDDAGSFALDLAAVCSVLREPRLTPVPASPPSVLGLANVHGDVVPVFDTCVLLDRAPLGQADYVVVVETPTGAAGLAVAAMPLAATLQDDDDRLTDVAALLP